MGFARGVGYGYFESELAFGDPFFPPQNSSEFGSGFSVLTFFTLYYCIHHTPFFVYTFLASVPLVALFMATKFIYLPPVLPRPV